MQKQLFEKNDLNSLEHLQNRDLNLKKEDRVLDFSDFQKQEIKFDIEKLQEAYHQIVKIKANNWDTHVLVKELSRKLNIGQKSIGFAGTKDKRAITTQHFSVKTSRENLSAINLENIELEFLHSSIKPIRLGNLVGNKFKIKVTSSSNNNNITNISCRTI